VYPIRSAGFAGFAGSWAIVTNALALSYLTTCGIIEERIDSHLRTLTLTLTLTLPRTAPGNQFLQLANW